MDLGCWSAQDGLGASFSAFQGEEGGVTALAVWRLCRLFPWCWPLVGKRMVPVEGLILPLLWLLLCCIGTVLMV